MIFSAEKRQKRVEKHWNGVLNRLKRNDSQEGFSKTNQGNYRSVTSIVNHETDFDAIGFIYTVFSIENLCILYLLFDFQHRNSKFRMNSAFVDCIPVAIWHSIQLMHFAEVKKPSFVEIRKKFL